MSAHLGEDYKPLKPSDTIKELSDMCFGHDYEEGVSSTVKAARDENGVFHVLEHDVTDHAAELAEALEDAAVILKCMGGEFSGIAKKAETALTKYKQSRGE